MFLFGGCIYASYPLITNICVCVHVSNCIKNIALALSKQRKRKSKRKKMTSNVGHTNQNDVSITALYSSHPGVIRQTAEISQEKMV